MKLLALDTATGHCSAALLLDGQLTELAIDAEKAQAENILPLVEQLLKEARLELKSLDAVAFGRGPGAFTGLRVAAAMAQGLAYGAGLPVLPISNLAALAHAARRVHGAGRVLACLDARMQEVYWGAFEADTRAVRAFGPEQLSAPTGLEAGPGPWFGAGSGWKAYGGRLGAGVPNLTGADGELAASAGDVARLAEPLLIRGEVLPPEQALPVYLRDQVAKPKL
ncbi:MAG TPA: tRNA (adenosine(37)-N6)-threonylcarbamoyltransferase complex dimerization subunit type 1 TsaB [Gammaproteobacteria bacterium]|nr:tRNA (adenosine(37)-N6)-threonylcarbamoyltransferase complex dimerization subunit type 1 TsaB [Gammaproteobacteria bacterium]